MKELENLRVLVYGEELNSYQKALAIQEFEQLTYNQLSEKDKQKHYIVKVNNEINLKELKRAGLPDILAVEENPVSPSFFRTLDAKFTLPKISCTILNLYPEKEPKPMTEWISVKDRLPKEYCHCLIYCPSSFPKNIRVLSATYYDDNNMFYCDASEVPHEDVTHWMPLPEPPKE